MIYLHIGRQKTGSTTLQRFLALNRDALQKAGLQFPVTVMSGNAHHGIALALSEPRMEVASDDRRVAAAIDLEDIVPLIAAGDNIIISSEMFQNVQPNRVATIFTPGNTEVFVYIREQLASLISTYAQSIKTTTSRTAFLDFAIKFKAAYNADYLVFLDAWASVFGADHLHVRIYDRGRLIDGDIRADFVAQMRLDPATLDFQPRRKALDNPTIGAAPIEFKGALNALVPAAAQRGMMLFRKLGMTASEFPRLQTSDRFADIFRGQFSESNAVVEERYLNAQRLLVEEVRGEGSLVDRDDAIRSGMEALSRVDPDAANRVAEYLDWDAIAKLDPLLPTDWTSAEAELERALAQVTPAPADE